ncbi:tRNA (adenosine(37)-N6)-threonylcarbamoyltransferase complex transferase subunit TsaD [Reichenbachiella carrageenanivorans]|uniref:tRNA N6-adenosine threonylcarbamoyltransferase n=1 Tax=Reichenbachiella carrageenanivorans TaxID=2979869 RepID=A0ABY6CZL2_9BACT|nr:tRNA (adenosine(37)-N6)-threonylcarbamoyltransferase complex transferase subunit TsaD [Reichenbachiella carrageenanivorans]UXX78874.1 tRNA (adenosine(37)-N6)-threonylcarbamoyltransferase complex transferase subunit TsaD [Reichenbachiella carrageenanivorans]
MKNVILAIESSCDETSASICIDGKVMNNVIATQEIHSKYGGVVPELASRAHQQAIGPVVKEAMATAHVEMSDLTAIAFTQGPGLLGALLVGGAFAKSMSLALGIPLIGVHHMKAHILAHFIEKPKPKFPFLCLTVSGGHTQIVRVDDYLDMTVLGQTTDDAVGEAFDKCAKLMGLPYPGGPLVDKLAKEGNENAFTFNETSMPGLDYSFSGIKTGFMNFLNKEKMKNANFVEEHKQDLCASIQRHLIDMLLSKLAMAVKQEGVSQVAIAGGVSANSGLRTKLEQLAVEKGWEVFIPQFQYCTDNAGMIGMTAHYQWLAGDTAQLTASPMPRMKF